MNTSIGRPELIASNFQPNVCLFVAILELDNCDVTFLGPTDNELAVFQHSKFMRVDGRAILSHLFDCSVEENMAYCAFLNSAVLVDGMTEDYYAVIESGIDSHFFFL
jgi:hypothetical protein